MTIAFVFLVLLLAALMHPHFDKNTMTLYLKENIAQPLIVLASTLTFIFFKEYDIYLFSLLLLLFSFYFKGKVVCIFEWYFALLVYLVFYYLKVPSQYFFLFGFICLVNKKLANKNITLALYLGISLIILLNPVTSQFLWAQFSSLLLIPLAVLVTFENSKDRLSQVLTLIMTVVLASTSAEFFKDFHFWIGLYIIFAALIRDLELTSKSLLLGSGAYLSFFTSQSILLIPAISFVFYECIYFKRLLLIEVKKVILDAERFSIEYGQITAFASLLVVLAGFPFSPFSLIYSLSSMSASLVVFLLLLDFPLLTFDVLGSEDSKPTIKENLLKILYIFIPLAPLAVGHEVHGFYFQLIPLFFTTFLFFYLQKNNSLEYKLQELSAKTKVNFEITPNKKHITRTMGKDLQKVDSLTFGTFTYKGAGFTLIFALYLIFFFTVVYGISK